MGARVWPDVRPELRDVHVEHTLILSDAGYLSHHDRSTPARCRPFIRGDDGLVAQAPEVDLHPRHISPPSGHIHAAHRQLWTQLFLFQPLELNNSTEKPNCHIHLLADN